MLNCDIAFDFFVNEGYFLSTLFDLTFWIRRVFLETFINKRTTVICHNLVFWLGLIWGTNWLICLNWGFFLQNFTSCCNVFYRDTTFRNFRSWNNFIIVNCSPTWEIWIINVESSICVSRFNTNSCISFFIFTIT
ncbi:Uncharacterised protein [Streptococcus suis]|nr:Uncharacterised protein [Streptococcus suis]